MINKKNTEILHNTECDIMQYKYNTDTYKIQSKIYFNN